MIKIKDLTEAHVGLWVEYDSGFKMEKGRIKSWNETWVFVVYNCNNKWDNFMNYTGCATAPGDLTLLKRENDGICN